MENNGKKNSNIIAIVGFILSFFIGLAGLVCSIIGLVKSKELKDGKGFSIAGIIISSLRIIISLFIFFIALIIVFKESRDIIGNVKNDIIEHVEYKNNKKENYKTNKISIFANNKNNDITFVYKTEPIDKYESGEQDNKYVTYVEVLINGIEVKGFNIAYSYGTNYDFLTGDNIKILKGSDKDYFILLIPEANYYVDGTINPTIANENGNILYTITYPMITGMMITDKKSILYEKGIYYLDNDKFYFVEPYCEGDKQNRYKEYILTIDKDIVNISEGNLVEGLSLACPES